MPIEFNCSNCLAKIRAEQDAVGKQVRCPACGMIVDGPSSASPPQRDPRESTVNPYGSPLFSDANQPTPGLPTPNFDLADCGSRLVAKIIDYMAMLGPFFGSFVIALIAVNILPNNQAGVAFGLCLLAGVLIMIGVTIYNLMLTAASGETIGKRIQQIRVVKESDGTPPGFVHGVLLRSGVMLLLGQIPFIGLVDVLMIFGDKRQCLHDLIASTRVVNGRF